MRRFSIALAALFLLSTVAWPSGSAPVFSRDNSGFVVPRPSDQAIGIPLGTSIFFALDGSGVDPSTIAVTLSQNGQAVPVIQNGMFSAGFSGTISNINSLNGPRTTVRIQPTSLLQASTYYTVQVSSPIQASWSFTTAPAEFNRALKLSLNARSLKKVLWNGQLWGGVVAPSFDTTQSAHQGDIQDMMDAVRQQSRSPVFSWYRPYSVTSDFIGNIWGGNPNVCREVETRRVSQIVDNATQTTLTLEDTFEHQLYGIADNRPLAGDYHPGDVVLVADRGYSEQASVVSVDDTAHTVTVGRLTQAAASWVLNPPNPVEPSNPNMVGQFTQPMCYLRKFSPIGTPVYYWGRLDQELDRLVTHDGFRLVFNPTGTPCDLSVTGVPLQPIGGDDSPNIPKDWAEYWNAIYALTAHAVARYGPAAQNFCYSVGNEFDLTGFYWRGTVEQSYAFYDYTVDAMMKALEDGGLDSSRAMVGGLEWATIFGNLNGVTPFSKHCSPQGGGTPNYAWKDPALTGRHSNRLTAVCSANHGQGSPCDFLSIHTYAQSGDTAQRVDQVKTLALSVDPVYFQNLQVRIHESCPNWAPNGDQAFNIAYRDTGYFPAWCADTQQRLIAKGLLDPRYANVESIVSIWPSDGNAGGINDIATVMTLTSGGYAAVPYPIFNFETLLGRMSHNYIPLKTKDIQGAHLSGFASIDPDGVRLMLYAIHPEDTECAGAWEYPIHLKLKGLPGTNSLVIPWRIDRDHATLRTGIRGLLGIGNPFATFTSQQVANLKAASALQPVAAPYILPHPRGSAAIDVTVGENGVAFVEILNQP